MSAASSVSRVDTAGDLNVASEATEADVTPTGPRVCQAYGAEKQGTPLTSLQVTLPALADDQVEVKILCCGVCASDIDACGKFGLIYKFPLIPGHEGIGRISAVGRLVRHLKLGQRVGIGVYRGACGACIHCTNGQNNMCAAKELMFMNSASGAFAEYVRLKAEFAIPIPDTISTKDAGPLLCAGITVFAPFRRFNIKSGERVGILGIGGLGHLAIQIGAKWGCEMVALSTSSDKATYAKQLGAHRFVDVTVPEDVKATIGTLDYLFMTASGDTMDFKALCALLASNGKLILLGITMKDQVISPTQLLIGQKSIAGSAAGSTGVALDMLRFCAIHNIRPVVEEFPFERVNEAIEKVTSNKIRFRAVLTRKE